jgi:uncharacterized membrane protein YgdD (TMEM256/DUF423 family)
MTPAWLGPRAAAAFGALAVALGAFGAHALKELLERNQRLDTWETAVLYHLLHAVAWFALALHPRAGKAPALCFALGILIFSGSLYILSITNIRWLGAITPLGGLAFIAGWLTITFSPPHPTEP